MPKVRTTMTIDEDVLWSVRVRAARSGQGDSEVIEEAVRRGPGLDVFECLWAKIRRWRTDQFELVLSEELLRELARV